MQVSVSSTAFFASKPPGPYMSVPASELSDFPKLAQQMKLKPRRVSLLGVAGLQLFYMDVGITPVPYWGQGRWRERDLFSRDGTSPPWPT